MRASTSIIAALLTLSPIATTAGAQGAGSDASPYQQYQEALSRGDLPAAESAGSAALAASETRSGDRGNTAALALNLARVRILLGRWQDAIAPARRAYDLSRSSAAAGVDPAMSGLLWGRVRLATEGFRAAGFLNDGLEEAAAREDLVGDRYDAAEQLGVWAIETRNFLIARGAWSLAANAAAGAPVDARYALGQARAFEAISIAMQSVTRDVVMTPVVARQVRERLAEAHGLVRPFAFAPGPQPTGPQELYAQIIGWDAAIWSKMATQNESRSDDPTLDANPSRIDGAAVCRLRRTEGRALTYPPLRWWQARIGAVVVRLRFDENGNYSGADIPAFVGDEEFHEHVAEVAATWRYAVEAADNCAAPHVYFLPISFSLRD